MGVRMVVGASPAVEEEDCILDGGCECGIVVRASEMEQKRKGICHDQS